MIPRLSEVLKQNIVIDNRAGGSGSIGRDLGAKAALTRTMTGQAYLLAANDIFWVSGWLCFLLIGMVWLCRKAKSGGGTPVAAD